MSVSGGIDVAASMDQVSRRRITIRK